MVEDPTTRRIRSLQIDATARSSREWAELEPEARIGRFFLASVEDARLLQAMKDMVVSCTEEGVSEAEFIHRARKMLKGLRDAAGMPYSDPGKRYETMTHAQRVAYENDTRHIDSWERLRLIYRTQMEMAQGYREFQLAFTPFWLQKFPGWQFLRQPGARIKRKDHVEHEGEVRLKTDVAYWLARNDPRFGGFNNPYPPFGYNSWMYVKPVSRADCVALGLLAPDEVVQVPPVLARWGLQAALDQMNSASVKGLRPEWVQDVARRVREQGGVTSVDKQGIMTASTPAPRAKTFEELQADIESINEEMRQLGLDEFI